MKYFDLPQKPVDPERAKWWALGLCAVACLIAAFTVKSNFDYFRQYYTGFAFWVRVCVFASVELAIITLPLTKGWGNYPQQLAALGCEVILISLSLFHTSLVGDSLQAKSIAERTKAEAQADFSRSADAAERIARQNQAAQESYNRAMANWNRAAAQARAMRQAPPPAPPAPQLQTVPQVSQALTDNSTLNVEQVGESRVSHGTLLTLLYLMLGGVLFTVGAQAYLANSSRLRYWLTKKREHELRELGGHLKSTPVYDTQNGGQPRPLFTAPQQTTEAIAAPEPRRAAGFTSWTPQSVGQAVGGSVPQSVRGSVQTQTPGASQSVAIAPQISGIPTKGGYSVQTAAGEYLCYVSRRDAERFQNMPSAAILSDLQGRVARRRDGGNKPEAIEAINRIKTGNFATSGRIP